MLTCIFRPSHEFANKGVINTTDKNVSTTPIADTRPKPAIISELENISDPNPMAVVSDVRKQAGPTRQTALYTASRGDRPSALSCRMRITICIPSVKPTIMISTGRMIFASSLLDCPINCNQPRVQTTPIIGPIPARKMATGRRKITTESKDTTVYDSI